ARRSTRRAAASSPACCWWRGSPRPFGRTPPFQLTRLDLVCGRSGDRLAGVVAVEAQGDVLAASLGLDVLDRVAVALPNVGIEGIAVLVLRARVPGLPLGQVFLADVFLGAGAGERGRIDPGAARSEEHTSE